MNSLYTVYPFAILATIFFFCFLSILMVSQRSLSWLVLFEAALLWGNRRPSVPRCQRRAAVSTAQLHKFISSAFPVYPRQELLCPFPTQAVTLFPKAPFAYSCLCLWGPPGYHWSGAIQRQIHHTKSNQTPRLLCLICPSLPLPPPNPHPAQYTHTLWSSRKRLLIKKILHDMTRKCQ